MAMTFCEAGGDATFNVATKTNGGFWSTTVGTPATIKFFNSAFFNFMRPSQGPK
jgi:hypothetical protein